ncbi:MAG TPA: hypothetical protein VH857_10875 [Actinomycetes bacterium]|nr:hypothetical protein [Actinomycetes bacterium]
MRWTPLLLSGVLVGLLLWWHHDSTTAGPGVEVLQTCGLVLGVGTAFLLDDPARATTAAVPLPLSWRTALPVLVGLVLVGTLWAGVLAWAAATSATGLPWAELSLQALAWTILVLAVAASARRLGDLDEPGPGAAAATAVIALLIHQLPGRFSLTGDPAATATVIRWAALLAVGTLGLVLAGRDPAAPRLAPARRGVPAVRG